MKNLVSFNRCIGEMFQAIDQCLISQLITPTLILLYSAIDAVARLDTGRSGKSQFLSWVEEYILSIDDFDCTATELYAARCGLVHTMTPNSDLSNNKSVRKLTYAWGDSDLTGLRHIIHVGDLNHVYASVQIEGLLAAFKTGIGDFVNDVMSDPSRSAVVDEFMGQFFNTLSKDDVFKLRDDGIKTLKNVNQKLLQDRKAIEAELNKSPKDCDSQILQRLKEDDLKIIMIDERLRLPKNE